MSEKVLQQEIKECIIDRLNLDVNPEDIDDDAPIFSGEDGEAVEGSLALDSVDALEIVVALNNQYDIESTDNDMMIFQSVNTIAQFVEEKRG